MQELIPTANVHVENYTQEAKAAGFGTSKKDTDYYPGKKKKKTLMDKIKFWKKK